MTRKSTAVVVLYLQDMWFHLQTDLKKSSVYVRWNASCANAHSDILRADSSATDQES